MSAAQAAWRGGPWLCKIRSPSGLVAVTVPSGSSMMPQPQRCTAIRWWKVHYADLRIMPTWGREPLVVALWVGERSA